MQQPQSYYTQDAFNFATLTRIELLDAVEELARENRWIRDCLAHKELTDREKIHAIVLHLYLETQPRLADGFRYYSRLAIAKLLGEIPKPPKRNKKGELVHDPGPKEQALSDVVSMFVANGALQRESKPQKNDPLKQNSFAFTFATFEDIALFHKKNVDEKPERGGKRLATCRHCGGTKLHEKVLYACEDCGAVMDEDQIIKISESTLEFQRQLDADLAEEMIRRHLTLLPASPPPPPPPPPAPPAMADEEPPEMNEARKLFKETRLRVRVSKTDKKVWRVADSGFDMGKELLIPNHEYIQRLEACCRSGDLTRVRVAIKEMKRYLKKD